MLNRLRRKASKITGRFRRRDRVFLLSHMRANTSLFGHLVGSHPQIEGYYELHESYREPADLTRTKLKYYRAHPPKRGARYFFDKILHNHHAFRPALLGPDDKVIFMIREPAPTVASIVKIFSDKPESPWASRNGAETYYRDRLEGLIELAEQLKGRYLFLSSEELVGSPTSTLERLTRFLELDQPLSERYERFEKTGKRGFGDSSGNIKAGRILTERSSRPTVEPVAESCERSYRDVLAKLEEYAAQTY